MQKFLDISRAAGCVAFCVLCAMLSIVAWRVEKALDPAIQSVATLSASTTEMADTVNTAMPQIQASAQSAFASVGATSVAVSGLVGDVRHQIPTVSARVNADLDDTHRLILESGLTAMEARKASAEERAALPEITVKTKRSLDDLHDELATLNTTTRDLDTLINDPANARTLKHLDEGTAALASTAKDGQQFTHGLLHPSWPHKVWGIVLDVAHVFNPL